MTTPDFQWLAGFECTAFPQVGTDELEATEHYRWWASDLVRLRDVGIRLIRYGIPWPKVNPQPHRYDWSWTDQTLDLMAVLGITPIIDLFHFGTPLWIEGGLMNPIFSEMQGWYAKAFAERYPHLLYYTPTNEPYIIATFGAEWGIWYPFLRGQRNAARAIANVGGGLARSMLAIREVQPQALMMIADTCEYYHSVDGAFAEEAEFRSERRFLMHDLYQGCVDREHRFWGYMLENGVREDEMQWFLDNPVRLDIMGCDYYRHSEHQLRRGAHGERIDEAASPERQLGWAALAAQYSERYGGIPVLLAETNSGGPPEERIEWLEHLVGETRRARAAGVPVVGITYYGAIDHVDWDSLMRVRNLNINPCGMWGLERQGDRLVRVPTAVVDWYRQHIAGSAVDSVGPISDPAAAERVRAVLAPAQSQYPGADA